VTYYFRVDQLNNIQSPGASLPKILLSYKFTFDSLKLPLAILNLQWFRFSLPSTHELENWLPPGLKIRFMPYSRCLAAFAFVIISIALQ
jgi:hypothetical protein